MSPEAPLIATFTPTIVAPAVAMGSHKAPL